MPCGVTGRSRSGASPEILCHRPSGSLANQGGSAGAFAAFPDVRALISRLYSPATMFCRRVRDVIFVRLSFSRRVSHRLRRASAADFGSGQIVSVFPCVPSGLTGGETAKPTPHRPGSFPARLRSLSKNESQRDSDCLRRPHGGRRPAERVGAAASCSRTQDASQASASSRDVNQRVGKASLGIFWPSTGGTSPSGPM